MEFKMIFELDEERMKRDGIDIEACRQEFQGFLDEVPEIEEIEKGALVAEDFETRSCLMYFLRHCEWFMKYVCKWICEDPNATDDVISDYRELGIRCCYE